MRSWPNPALSCHTVGQHGATLYGGVSAHCGHIRQRPLRTDFTHCTHLIRTRQAPVFARGLAPFFAHSCWTHGPGQAVPTASGTFFERLSFSSKNVAAERKTGWFGGQRLMGTTRAHAASSTVSQLRTRCGYGPACRPLRQWATAEHTRMALPAPQRG